MDIPIAPKSPDSSLQQHQFLINDLKWFQTKILFEKQYFQYIDKTYKNVNVLIDKELTRVLFKGDRGEIEKAKNEAFEILSQILGCECDCDEEKLARMKARDEDVQRIVKSAGLCCIVDTKSESNKYTIYATRLNEIEKCKKLLAENSFESS